VVWLSDRETRESERYLVVAEKASVARAIKYALSSTGVKMEVTSVRGHMMNADLPRGYEWDRADPLNIIKLRQVETVVTDRSSYEKLSKLFSQGPVLIVATDNDSEGELIGSEILELYRSHRGPDAPYWRMRFNSLSRGELLSSWKNREPSLNWNWVEKARFRMHFDLLTGASFTRLLTLNTRKKARVRLISWGSCQTPTLNFVVEREKEIRSFKPEKYWFMRAELEALSGERFTASSPQVWSSEEAEALRLQTENATSAAVTDYEATATVSPRPLPTRTDDMLRELSRITNVASSRLLGVMEDLYADGYLSYPRTDTNRYRPDFDFEQPRRSVEEAGLLEGFGEVRLKPVPRNGRLDDGAHPPIYPTKPYLGEGLPRLVWEYAARRFYANAYLDDAETMKQKVKLLIGNVTFSADGNYLAKEGYYRLFNYFRPRGERLPELRPGDKLRVLDIKMIDDETKPPPRLREADLLRLMEKNGLGTDATRATYPTLIIQRGYARRVANVFNPTALGMSLIESLAETDRRLVTPETRRMVEEKMKLIGDGSLSFHKALEESTQAYEQLLLVCHSRIDAISERLARALQPKPLSHIRMKPRLAEGAEWRGRHTLHAP